MTGPEDNPKDDEQPTKEEYEAWGREQEESQRRADENREIARAWSFYPEDREQNRGTQ